MEKRKLYSILELSPQTYVCLAVALLFIPLRWVFAWLLSALIHESCHLGMIHLTGGSVVKIHIGAAGAKICPTPMPAWKVMLCAAAGPIGSLLLLFVAKWFPCVAICAFLQALWNMIPMYPLDGGRILHSFVQILFPYKAEKITQWMQITVVGVLCLSCILTMALFRSCVLPMIILAVLLLKSDTVKIPCKQSRLRVQ